MSDDSDKNPLQPDLTALTGFQFGPAWARDKDTASKKEYSQREFKDRNERKTGGKPGFKRDGERRNGPRTFNRQDEGNRRERRDFHGERSTRGSDRPFSGGNRRFDSQNRPQRQAPEPVTGVRAEIRPINTALASIAAEVHKHKRCYSLYDLAKVFMGGRDRYEIWFIKEENGPEMILGKKSPSLWLEEREAIASVWNSPWFSEYYEEKTEETDAPKGQFSAIARCGMSDTLIGPVNWHGYQVALAKLHAERFSHLPFEKFKSRIVIEKSEEAVAQWLESATQKTVWIPTRENAGELTLRDRSEVEADFKEHHFEECFEKTAKCHVPGDIAGKQLSQGLFAHLLKLVETARRHPAQIIPNVCHGLARHHLPIFKWKGGHHTGPSRPHALPEETKLAQRPAAIIEWIKQNPGGRVDVMLAALVESLQTEEIPSDSPIDKEQVACDAKTIPDVEPLNKEQPSANEENLPVSEENPTDDQGGEDKTEKASSSAKEENIAGNMGDSSETLKDQPSETSHVISLQEALIGDLMWLLQQGFVLVTPDGKIHYPKNAPVEQPVQAKNKEKKSKKNANSEKKSTGKKGELRSLKQKKQTGTEETSPDNKEDLPEKTDPEITISLPDKPQDEIPQTPEESIEEKRNIDSPVAPLSENTEEEAPTKTGD